MKQQTLAILADAAMKSAVSRADESVIARRISLLTPLVNLLCGEAELAEVEDIDMAGYATALAMMARLPPGDIKLYAVSMIEIDELYPHHEDYELVPTSIVLTENRLGNRDLGIDPLWKNLDLVKAAMLPIVDAFVRAYGQPLRHFDKAMQVRIMSLPINLASLVVNYSAYGYEAGLRRIAPFVRQLPQALLIGVPEGAAGTTWTILSN